MSSSTTTSTTASATTPVCFVRFSRNAHTRTGLPLRNLTRLVDNYKTLVSQVVERNCSRDHFVIDFINEPDATGYLWEVPPWHTPYTRTRHHRAPKT